MPPEIKRGEIYRVNWNPSRGSEQAGIRPALVIQNDTGNKLAATTIVASCSTSIGKPYPFQVKIDTRISGLPEDSVVDLGQLMTVDKSRLVEKLGQLNSSKMNEVDVALKISLGLQYS